MLVDIDLSLIKESPLGQALGDMALPSERVARGVYIADLNWNHTLSHSGLIKDDDPFRVKPPGAAEGPHAWKVWHTEVGAAPSTYGVCDHYLQILQKWPVLESDPRSFLIRLYEVCKNEEPIKGGWRWRKWGRYIGVKEPQHEYIAHEGPDIERVFCFHIYEASE